jgi:hypothetical protein
MVARFQFAGAHQLGTGPADKSWTPLGASLNMEDHEAVFVGYDGRRHLDWNGRLGAGTE